MCCGPSLIPIIVTMYLVYSINHRSNRRAGGISDSATGHATILTPGNSDCIKCFARRIWSSVVTTTIRSNPERPTILRIATAFWYVDLDSDSIFARSVFGYPKSSGAPIIYKSESGYFSANRIANGIRRKSPVKTNMLSFGKTE